MVCYLGRGPCKSYSAEDRSSIDNEEDCAELQDIGDDQVIHEHGWKSICAQISKYKALHYGYYITQPNILRNKLGSRWIQKETS